MKILTLVIAVLSVGFLATSCVSNHGSKNGSETPIDSTDVHGTAPAQYGGENPATDTGKVVNYKDTGTTANTVNAPNYDSTNAAQRRHMQ